MAMLSGMVNIAVFAAFSFRIGGVLSLNAEFKPICGLRELDVSRYGWQKRQDPATEVARFGKVGGKNGNVWRGYGDVHVATPVAAMGRARVFLTLYEVVQVLAASDGAAVIELKYHKERWLSRAGG